MKLSRISFLITLLVLLIPSIGYAQSAANKSWPSFWTKFSSAVRAKNREAVKNLMASESEFSASGSTGRDDWLDFLHDNNGWISVQRSVAKGVRPFSGTGIPSRITRDSNLIFQYIHGKWRFMGPGGD